MELEQFKSWFVLMEYRLGVPEKSRQPEQLIEFFWQRVSEAYPTRGLAIIGKAFDLYAAGKLEGSKEVTFAYHPPITEKLMFSILAEVNANEAARERERETIERNSFDDVKKEKMQIDVAVNIVNALLSEYQNASDTDLRWLIWKEAFRRLYESGIIFDYVSGSVDFETGEVLTAREVCERAALRAQNNYLDNLKWRATTDKDLKNELFKMQNSPDELRRAASIPAIRSICGLILENTKTVKQ